MMIFKDKPTIDSNYIQQHLANERTYLAWIRTSITIIGVGFLITNLHFSFISKDQLGDILAQTIGLASIFVGIVTIILSTIGYFKKGRDINNQTFNYPRVITLCLSILLLLIFLFFGIYYLFIWELL
ncbi:YidH family protein [Robertmurraya sp.]|jgi:putative membrane protein|uniref:YidH family protein n=1 Tax=Robertmurraya sp. TaxID=2837525 RepID=UPI00370438FF